MSIVFVYHYFALSKRSTDDDVINVVAYRVVRQDIEKQVQAIGELFAKQTINVSSEVAGRVNKIYFQNGQNVTANQLLFQLDNELYQARYAKAAVELKSKSLSYKRYASLSKNDVIPREVLNKITAQYQEQQANLDVNDILLKKMQIVAPFVGTISASRVSVGQYVKEGQPLAELYDSSHFVVRYSIPEKFLQRVKLGQTVTITTSTYEDKIFHGIVSYISPRIDNNTHTLMLWADINNTNSLLAPGLFVSVSQAIGIDRQVMVIPQKALIPTVEGNDVFVVHHNKAFRIPVEVGRFIGSQVIINKGLATNDHVIILGQEKLNDAQTIKVVPE